MANLTNLARQTITIAQRQNNDFGPAASGRFDFTILFEDIFLSIGPSVLLLLAGPPRLWALYKQPLKVKKSALHESKLVSIIVTDSCDHFEARCVSKTRSWQQLPSRRDSGPQILALCRHNPSSFTDLLQDLPGWLCHPSARSASVMDNLPGTRLQSFRASCVALIPRVTSASWAVPLGASQSCPSFNANQCLPTIHSALRCRQSQDTVAE